MIDLRELVYEAVGPWGQAVLLISVLVLFAASMWTSRPGADR